jgi:WD40 repeat protein
VFHGHTGEVTSVLFRSDDQAIASGSTDGTVRLWTSFDPAAAPVVLRAGMSEVEPIAFSDDGTKLTTRSGPANVRTWDLQPDADPFADFAHGEMTRPVAYSGDGNRIAVGVCQRSRPPLNCEHQTVEVRNLDSTDGTAWSLDLAASTVVTLALSPDGRWLAAGLCPTELNEIATCDDPEVGIWDLSSPEPASRFLLDGGPWLSPQAFSHDGHFLVAGGTSNDVLLWDLTSIDAPPTRLAGHTQRVRTAAIDPLEQWIASGGDDGSVRLWNLEHTGEPSIVLGKHSDWVWSVAFDRQGKRLASGSRDGTVRIWEPGTRSAQPVVLNGHKEWVNAVAFDDDGSTVVSASDDGTVRFWDLNNGGQDAIVVDLQSGSIWSVIFQPGKEVAVARDSYGDIFVLPTTARLAEMICERVGRNLTTGEWSNLVGTDITYEPTCPNLATKTTDEGSQTGRGDATPGVATPGAATPVALITPKP